MSDTLDLAQLLDTIGCHSYSLHITDAGYWADRNPDATEHARKVDIRLTIVGRVMFHRVCAALGAKPTERVVHAGQRAWVAEADTKTRRLLIEGVSFRHNDDWLSRDDEDAEVAQDTLPFEAGTGC